MLWGLIAVVGLYLAVVATITIFQRRYLYHPRHNPPTDHAGFQRLTLTVDGNALAALHHPAAPGQPTAVLFNGNAGTLDGGVELTAPLRRAGYGVLLPSYPGYDGNPGKPSERTLYATGHAAMAWLAASGVAAPVVIGYSMGGAVAVEIATTHEIRALVLLAPFFSMASVAQPHMPILPVGLLLRDRFDNAAKIGLVHVPLLMAHGDADRTVPIAEGRALYERANQPKQFLLEPGITHAIQMEPVVPALERLLAP